MDTAVTTPIADLPAGITGKNDQGKKKVNGPVAVLAALKLPTTNFIALVMEAIQKNDQSESAIEITDANQAMSDISMQSGIYQYWDGENGQLDKDSQAVQLAVATSDGKGKSAEEVTAAQSQYSKDAAEANSMTSQAGTMTQQASTTVQTDSTNMQNAAQNGQQFMEMFNTLAQSVSRVAAG